MTRHTRKLMTERQRFEAWVRRKWLPWDLNWIADVAEYKHSNTHWAWLVWQASARCRRAK